MQMPKIIPNVDALVYEIETVYFMEQHYAVKNDKLKKHYQKWSTLYPDLQDREQDYVLQYNLQS